jgi:hypothetical protein
LLGRRVEKSVRLGPTQLQLRRQEALDRCDPPGDVTQIRGPPEAFEPLDDGWGSVANDDEPDAVLIDDVA